MENIPPTRGNWKHLSDVDVGKILGLAKAAMPQPKIAALMKCSQNAIQNILATISLKPFKDTTRFDGQFIELFNHPSKSLKARYQYGEAPQEV